MSFSQKIGVALGNQLEQETALPSRLVVPIPLEAPQRDSQTHLGCQDENGSDEVFRASNLYDLWRKAHQLTKP